MPAILDTGDAVLDAVARGFDMPLDAEPVKRPVGGLPLDRALVTVHELQLDHDIDPAEAVRRLLRDHRLTAEAMLRAASVGLAALAAWYYQALDAFLAFGEPDDIRWPLRVGLPTDHVRFANARWLLDADGRRVGVVDSDEGPALVGPLDRIAVAVLLDEGRAVWITE